MEWKSIYEKLLGRKLEDEDLMFPSLNTSLAVQQNEPVTDTVITKMINNLATKASLPGAGQYRTHCFRRGGAQYRFMFAPVAERWILARIRWWGGWAQKEKVRFKFLYATSTDKTICPG